MATYRRVVTGHRADGKSIITSDEKVTGVEVPDQPGSTLISLWGADEIIESLPLRNRRFLFKYPRWST